MLFETSEFQEDPIEKKTKVVFSQLPSWALRTAEARCSIAAARVRLISTSLRSLPASQLCKISSNGRTSLGLPLPGAPKTAKQSGRAGLGILRYCSIRPARCSNCAASLSDNRPSMARRYSLPKSASGPGAKAARGWGDLWRNSLHLLPNNDRGDQLSSWSKTATGLVADFETIRETAEDCQHLLDAATIARCCCCLRFFAHEKAPEDGRFSLPS